MGRIQIGGGQGIQTSPPGKSQVAIGFLRNSGTNPLREAIGSIGSIAKEPIASQGSSVKYVDDQKKKFVRTTPDWIRPCGPMTRLLDRLRLV